MTACPLDCYDACQVILEEGKLKGGKDDFTNGSLCSHLYQYDRALHITQASWKDTKCSLDEATSKLLTLLKETDPSKVLLYRGSGNLGKMQAVTDLFFSQYGASLTKGSLCDAAGHDGIVEGRGYNEVVSPEQIAKSDVVVLWGRNPSNTNSHLLKVIEGKKLIVIDPIETSLAKKADMHIQVKPRGDFYLAMLMSRFAMMEEMEDKAYIDEYADNFQWFFEFSRSVRIKVAMDKADILPNEIYAFLNLIKDQKVVFLVGNSVQKVAIGDSVLRAIDSFAVLLGLMGKEGCGVSFLGDSSLGVKNPFEVKAKREPKATADFSKYDLVVFQGSNALESMPDSNRVEHSLEGKTVVYFGLHENLTSKRADLIIPAKNFLAKEDIRFSYMDHSVKRMNQEIESQNGISEYALTKQLSEAFDLSLEEEEDYIETFLSSCEPLEDNLYRVNNRSDIAYKDGFDSEDGAFIFIDESDDNFKLEENSCYLITPKSKKALNTMFERPSGVHVHPSMGFSQGQKVEVSSSYGTIALEVVHNEGLRTDTICIYASTPGVNKITPSRLSDSGFNAVYHEISVKVQTC